MSSFGDALTKAIRIKRGLVEKLTPKTGQTSLRREVKRTWERLDKEERKPKA